MPYNTIAEFAAAVATAQANHNNAYRRRLTNEIIAGTVDDVDVQNAWAVYRRAMHTNLQSLVLGRWVPNSTELNPGIDQTTRDNFHQMNEVDYGGSVMNSANWSVLMNDAWVLGGIHSHTPFYLASPRTQANIDLRQGGDPGTWRFDDLTVTGRELLGLLTFGYEIVRANPTLGEAGRVLNAGLANGATFDAYLTAVGNALDNRRVRPGALAQLQVAARDISGEYH